MRLFAHAREAAGTAHDVIDAATIEELLAEAGERYGPEFVALLPRCRVWVNGDEPREGHATRLGPKDEVAVLPPVSGGAA